METPLNQRPLFNDMKKILEESARAVITTDSFAGKEMFDCSLHATEEIPHKPTHGLEPYSLGGAVFEILVDPKYLLPFLESKNVDYNSLLKELDFFDHNNTMEAIGLFFSKHPELGETHPECRYDKEKFWKLIDNDVDLECEFDYCETEIHDKLEVLVKFDFGFSLDRPDEGNNGEKLNIWISVDTEPPYRMDDGRISFDEAYMMNMGNQEESRVSEYQLACKSFSMPATAEEFRKNLEYTIQKAMPGTKQEPKLEM